jgi:accessory gene regulator protein AgrB
MPEHPTLRIRTPPCIEEVENADKENHKNIMIMLILTGILHLIIYYIIKDELFFWISIMFMVVSLITTTFVKKRRRIEFTPVLDSVV